MNAQRAGVQTLMTDAAHMSPHPAFAAIRLLERASVAATEAEQWEGETALAGVRRRDARALVGMVRQAFAAK